MTPQNVLRWLRTNAADLFECSAAPRGAVRVRTPLTYPDGDVIEVFVLERDGGCTLTDYGDTLGWLRMQSVSGELTKIQTKLIDDICRGLGVRQASGQLVLDSVAPEELADAVFRLSQVALRVTDIQLTFRRRRIHTIADDVDNWLRAPSRGFSVQRSAKRTGAIHTWTVDYAVSLRDVTFAERTSLMFLLSPGDPSRAWSRTEHVFVGFSDLQDSMSDIGGITFISLFDDLQGDWSEKGIEESMQLVGKVSSPVRWSQRDELTRVLSSALMPLSA